MRNGLIVYFSQGGTTAQVAEAVAAGLRTRSWQLDLHNLRDGPPAPVGRYDLLGLGSPAYYYRPPFIVSDYVRRLPPLEGRPAFIFVLHGTYPGHTAGAIWRALSRRGARPVGCWHGRGADFFLGYLNQGYLFSPGQPTVETLAAAQAFGRRVAGHIAARSRAGGADIPPLPLACRLERALASRWMARLVYSRLFRVDEAKCTHCGLCVEICPTSNITTDAAGRPVWGRNCLLCLYCQMRCPEEAISSPVDWPLLRPIIRHNVRQAVRDPAIDYAPVRHRHGKTRRLREAPSEWGED